MEIWGRRVLKLLFFCVLLSLCLCSLLKSIPFQTDGISQLSFSERGKKKKSLLWIISGQKYSNTSACIATSCVVHIPFSASVSDGSLHPARLSLVGMFEYSCSSDSATVEPATAPKTAGNSPLTINRPNSGTTPPRLLWVIVNAH